MSIRDNSHDLAEALARALRPLLVLVGLLVTVMTLPWLGVGYCAYAGGSLCPSFMSPQQGGAGVAERRRPADVKPPARVTQPGKGTSKPPALLRAPINANPKWVALVVGNGAYAPPNALANPANDATDVAGRLSALGYTLVRDPGRGTAAWLDLTYERLDAAMRQFAETARDADVALIYYAGHGMEEAGTNYLIPVDAQLDRDVDLANEGYPFDSVTRRLPRYGISIVIIDACRTPRFRMADQRGNTRAVEGQRGFQVVEAPDRALFAFSAGPNQRASDGKTGTRNSPYTEELLEAMAEPDVQIEDVFKTVRQRFIERNEAQKPEFRDNLGRPNLAFAPPEPPKKPGERFRDCPECPQMVVLPAGRFLMGAPATEEGAGAEERPQHEVSIPRDFAVGLFEVTFDEWDACVKGGGCNGYPPADEGWGRGRRPVIYVSWLEAQAYVQWLNSLSTKGRGKYRLLSEMEWEYAARASTNSAFSFGATILATQANFDGSTTYATGTKGENRQRTVPAGTFSANLFGLHDAHGNVWEWTQDCWNDSYAGAPADGRAWLTGDCNRRVLRGGSWISSPQNVRSAIRNWNYPTYRSNSSGFRVARGL